MQNENFCMLFSAGKDRFWGISWSLEYRNVTITDLSSNVALMLRLSHRDTLEDGCVLSWIHQQSGSVAPLISSLLCQPLMSCSRPDPVSLPLLSPRHIPASLHDSLATSVWHLLMGLGKRHFSPKMKSLSGKLKRLCANSQPLLHFLSRYIRLLGGKCTFFCAQNTVARNHFSGSGFSA